MKTSANEHCIFTLSFNLFYYHYTFQRTRMMHGSIFGEPWNLQTNFLPFENAWGIFSNDFFLWSKLFIKHIRVEFRSHTILYHFHEWLLIPKKENLFISYAWNEFRNIMLRWLIRLFKSFIYLHIYVHQKLFISFPLRVSNRMNVFPLSRNKQKWRYVHFHADVITF